MKKISYILSSLMTAAGCVLAGSLSASAYYSTGTILDKAGMFILAIVLIVGGLIVAVFAIILTIKKNMGRTKRIESGNAVKKPAPGKQISMPVSDLVPNNYNEIIASQIRKRDPDFSSMKFCEWSKSVFIRMLTSMSDNDLRDLRLLTTKQMYDKLGTELDSMTVAGTINIFNNIKINRAYLHLLWQKPDFEHLTVYLYGNMQCYMANLNTKEPLKNYMTESQPFKYLLTFRRSIGARTFYINGTQAICCSRCGAPTEDSTDVKCSYCGSPLTAGNDNWLLSDVQIMTDNRPLDDRGTVIEI